MIQEAEARNLHGSVKKKGLCTPAMVLDRDEDKRL